MLLVFKNAMSFNKRGTGVYKAASNMKRFFNDEKRRKKLNDHLIF